MKYSPWVILETLFKSDGNPFLFLIYRSTGKYSLLKERFRQRYRSEEAVIKDMEIFSLQTFRQLFHNCLTNRCPSVLVSPQIYIQLVTEASNAVTS